MIDLIIAIASGLLEFFISIFTYRADANYALMTPMQAQLAVTVGSQVFGHLFGRKKRRRELAAANAERKEGKAAYMNLDFTNPYKDLKNPYDNMENPMEDLTVNLKQAEFKANQQAQQQVNTLDALKGAAGGSGIAGLAQSVLNQKVKKGQEASASIGLQESANSRLAAKGALSIDSARRGQEGRNQLAEAKGDFASMRLEKERTETLYGMGMQRTAAAKNASNNSMKSMIGGVGSALTGYAGTAEGSDLINSIFTKE